VPDADATPGVEPSDVDTADGETAESGHRSVIVEFLGVYLKGLAMGAADTVPGVSGGTIALITGIYERLITALTELDPRALGHLGRAHRPDGRAAFVSALRRMDVPFLVALGLGVVTVVVLLSRVVHAALTSYEAETAAFFFGLIFVSAVVLRREVSLETGRQVAAGVAGFAIAFVLAGASADSGGAVAVATPLPLVFGVAAVAISAMVLPGVSGAFILYLVGQYEYLTGVLKAFVDHVVALPSRGITPGLVDSGVVVLTFVGGAFVGVFSVAYAVRWALDRAHAATLTFLVSLMVGSLRLPFETVTGTIGTWSASAAAGVGAAALVGGLAVFLLDRYTDDLEYGAAT
jgi:putative membrane protein